MKKSQDNKSIFISPLRYPGGKSSLTFFLSKVLEKNNFSNGIYIEAFAGGAGAALNLLFSKKVSSIILNDLDSNVFKFWTAILQNTTDFITLIKDTPITISTWKKQKDILNENSSTQSDLKMAFAFFYLNRCNRSGIMSSGPIGGYSQEGEWKINARFNKDSLISKILTVSNLKDKITLYNEDANDFINKIVESDEYHKDKSLLYLDPPYYLKGRDLYKLYFNNDDHEKLLNTLKAINDHRWIMSYDNVSYISKLYKGYPQKTWKKKYSVSRASIGKELIIHSENCIVPRSLIV